MKIVCIDFDGVLHSYKSGWCGAEKIPDPPVPGAIEWFNKLVADPRVKVHVYSSRSLNLEGRLAMRVWLQQHGADLSDVEFPEHKPPAHVSIDDRGYRFNGSHFPSAAELLELEPWWRGSK